MTVVILPVVAFLFVSAAVRRYRGDSRAVAAGVAAGLAGTLGVALALPEVNLMVPTGGFFSLAAVAIAVAALSSIYAEARRRQAHGEVREHT